MAALTPLLGRHFLPHPIKRLNRLAAHVGKSFSGGPYDPLQLVWQPLNYCPSHRGVQRFGSPASVVRTEPNVGDSDQFNHSPLRCDGRRRARSMVDQP